MNLYYFIFLKTTCYIFIMFCLLWIVQIYYIYIIIIFNETNKIHEYLEFKKIYNKIFYLLYTG